MRTGWTACVAAMGLAGVVVETGRAIEVRNYCVEVSATVSTSPTPRVVLNWPADPRAPSYDVYRRDIAITGWGVPTSLAVNATAYTDTVVSVGAAYEYKIEKRGTATGSGTIYAGIEVPVIEDRGKLVLIVDNTYANDLVPELVRLQQDLAGDGWTVLRHDVARTMSVPDVKAIIQADYNADTNNVKSVFLFGHVAVPYSGLQNPDGHGDHYGAWPADVYYADMDGMWTDTTASNTQASSSRQWNLPGDGKFDQRYFPGQLELQVGRVDLGNMQPRFPQSEKTLLLQYLNKDHDFRHHRFTVPRRGLIDNGFGLSHYSTDGWRNFAPFFGATNSAELDWFQTLPTEPHLWAYGCGFGGFDYCAGVGGTADFSTNAVNAVFTMLYGSYFGDWDTGENLMRAVLASSPLALTCSWSGGSWTYHEMGLGLNIGFSVRRFLNQNTSPGQCVELTLLGDPTLRLHPVGPPASLVVTPNGGGVDLAWGTSPDTVAGYHVYRGTSTLGPFARISTNLVSGAAFTDVAPPAGTNVYMVRAVKLETSGSGTYYNPSQGVFGRYPDQVLPLVVTSPYGAPQPPSGTNLLSSGSFQECVLPDSPVVSGLTQYVCKGWTGTGGVPSSGATTNTSLLLTADSTIIWAWDTNYWLNASAGANGTLEVSNGWCRGGTTVTLTAVPTARYQFSHWTGDGVPAGQNLISPLTVTMDRARTLVANFDRPPNTSNTVPYAESFESYAPGTALPGSNGWYAANPDAAVVSTDTVIIARLRAYPVPCRYPLSTNHAQVAVLDAPFASRLTAPTGADLDFYTVALSALAITNRIMAPTGVNLWVDCMLDATRLDGDLPPVGPDVQCAMCVDTNGRFNIWHRDITAGTNRWSTLNWQTMQTTQWVRVTLQAAYAADDAINTARYVQVYLDGLLMTNDFAYTLNNGSGALGGTWLAMAAVSAPTTIHEFCLSGEGALDDVVVTTHRPLLDVGPFGTPEWWLVRHGLTNGVAVEELGDADGDMALNWQEHLAGTDPTNKTSVLRFVNVAASANERLPLLIETVAGVTYSLVSSTNLPDAHWGMTPYAFTAFDAMQATVIVGTGGIVTLYVQPSGPFQAYRVEVLY